MASSRVNPASMYAFSTAAQLGRGPSIASAFFGPMPGRLCIHLCVAGEDLCQEIPVGIFSVISSSSSDIGGKGGGMVFSPCRRTRCHLALVAGLGGDDAHDIVASSIGLDAVE